VQRISVVGGRPAAAAAEQGTAQKGGMGESDSHANRLQEAAWIQNVRLGALAAALAAESVWLEKTGTPSQTSGEEAGIGGPFK
jgi:hypothetical protein